MTQGDTTYDDYYATLSPTALSELTVVMFGPEEPAILSNVELPDGSIVSATANAFGGCVATAREAIFDGLEFEVIQDQIEQIAADSTNRASADPRVVSLISEWSDCMSAAGYVLTDPLSAPSTFQLGSEAPSTDEIEQAVADVGCKTAVGLIAKFREVRNGIEVDVLSRRVGLLERWKELSDAALDRAEAVLNSS